MVDVLNESTAGSWITQTHFHQRVFNRTFDDPFKLELMLKDMGIAVELAQETKTPVPLWGLGQQLWRMADLRRAARRQRQRAGALGRETQRHRAASLEDGDDAEQLARADFITAFGRSMSAPDDAQQTTAAGGAGGGRHRRRRCRRGRNR